MLVVVFRWLVLWQRRTNDPLHYRQESHKRKSIRFYIHLFMICYLKNAEQNARPKRLIGNRNIPQEQAWAFCRGALSLFFA